MGEVTKLPAPKGSLVELLDRGVGAIKAIAASHGHHDPVQTRQETDVTVDEVASARVEARQRKQPSASSGPVPSTSFRRGQVVRHKPTGRKVTVMKAHATSCEIVDSRSGRRWVARNIDLT